MKYNAIKLTFLFLIILICVTALPVFLQMRGFPHGYKDQYNYEISYYENGSSVPVASDFIKGLEISYDIVMPGRKLHQSLGLKNDISPAYTGITTAMTMGQFAYDSLTDMDTTSISVKYVKYNSYSEFDCNGYSIEYDEKLSSISMKISKNGQTRLVDAKTPIVFGEDTNFMTILEEYTYIQNISYPIMSTGFSDVILIKRKYNTLAVDLGSGEVYHLSNHMYARFLFWYEGNIIGIDFTNMLPQYAMYWNSKSTYYNLYLLVNVWDTEGNVLGKSIFDTGYPGDRQYGQAKNIAIRRV